MELVEVLIKGIKVAECFHIYRLHMVALPESALIRVGGGFTTPWLCKHCVKMLIILSPGHSLVKCGFSKPVNMDAACFISGSN